MRMCQSSCGSTSGCALLLRTEFMHRRRSQAKDLILLWQDQMERRSYVRADTGKGLHCNTLSEIRGGVAMRHNAWKMRVSHGRRWQAATPSCQAC